MKKNTFIDDAKITSKGQVTIPKKIRSVLGIHPGDRITFIVKGNSVHIERSSDYIMRQFCKQENKEDASEKK